MNSFAEPYLAPYDTFLLNDVWESADEFLEDYNGIGIPATISDANATVLFYLLYGRYANCPISNYDMTQFKYKLFSIVWQYGPTWEKRLDIQSKLRALSDADLLAGTKVDTESEGTSGGTVTDVGSTINNHAYNPGTAPTTQTTSELDYVDQQNVAKANNTNTTSQEDSRTHAQTITKSKMDAYSQLWELLDNDVTSEFLDKFRKLFKQFVAYEKPLLYVSGEEDED